MKLEVFLCVHKNWSYVNKEEKKNKIIYLQQRTESAKFRASCAFVAHVPCVLHALVPRVPHALRALVSHVPRDLRAVVSQVRPALRTPMPHMPHAQGLSSLTCLATYVLSCLTFLMSYVL